MKYQYLGLFLLGDERVLVYLLRNLLIGLLQYLIKELNDIVRQANLLNYRDECAGESLVEISEEGVRDA